MSEEPLCPHCYSGSVIIDWDGKLRCEYCRKPVCIRSIKASVRQNVSSGIGATG
jgi:hypothetical protein